MEEQAKQGMRSPDRRTTQSRGQPAAAMAPFSPLRSIPAKAEGVPSPMKRKTANGKTEYVRTSIQPFDNSGNYDSNPAVSKHLASSSVVNFPQAPEAGSTRPRQTRDLSPEKKTESPSKSKAYVKQNRNSMVLTGIRDHLSRQLDPMFKDKPK